MREIKFRLFCPYNKEMYYNDDVYFELKINRDGSISYSGNHDGYEFHSNIEDDISKSILKIIPMQFTGLNDKNAREIYEGDIIKNTRKWSFGLDSGSHFVVEFNVETGRYGLLLRGERLRDSWEDLAALTRKKSKECEIVGNIYENPELLENDKIKN